MATLNIWASLNVLCNTVSNKRWEDNQSLRYSQPSTVLIKTEGWIVFVDTLNDLEGRI